MIFVSLLINTVVFFVILNLSYFKKKRNNPDYPEKPFSQTVLFPLCLGIVFTLIMDAFKGIIFYQFILFIVAALLLYWIFFMIRRD
jgi:L-cystine uptake protein TcyP (sodium:dicarboxylate symporter family)